jgi:hypothetical protein
VAVKDLWIELWAFLRVRKRYWLFPVVIALLLVAGLIAVSGTALAPFIYTIF